MVRFVSHLAVGDVPLVQTWDSYQSLTDWWHEQDDPDGGKPTPPSTDKTVTGHLRGGPDAMDELRDALRSDEVAVGQAELLYRDGVYYHTITKRCQEYGKTSTHRKLGDQEERFTEWVLHRLSRAVVEFAAQFSKPVIAFEDMSGLRNELQYGTYLNRRLHKLPFHCSIENGRLRQDY